MKTQAPLVNLNVNPCKMCMPMGASCAFYGIKGCMPILHGSQGCATYIRRHMATHFNEPVDIASSSLTEQGTVFGGEENLVKGLQNLIALYHPEVIGVATTCLAETIGEDVDAYIRRFYENHPEHSKVKIISVASAGYGGTQYEGFFRVLRAVVEQVEQNPAPNGKINIVTPMISPADTRWLKEFLKDMGVDAVLLPDISENLDGVSMETYERLKTGGTPLADVAKMAGARLTIEFSKFIDNGASPAAYLDEQFGVPFVRLPLPTGIRAMDELIRLLEEYGYAVPEKIKTERGRYLDAMVDAHKYCAEGRAAVFGEPDFVYAVSRLCCENGVVPVLAATGSVCRDFRESLEEEIRQAAARLLVEKTEILDDCDFKTIEEKCEKLGANLMVGSSDGRRISHKLHIPLVRSAFPIHDRVGGQRVRTLGFEGSLFLLDSMANILLGGKEESFRDEIYRQHFGEKKESDLPEEKPRAATDPKAEIMEKTLRHPCFNCGGGENARIHLPVAPGCNIQCNYCVRKYDCPNESRPGVTTEVLSPQKALEKYLYVKERVENLTVVGIAGPGDSLAEFDKTKETLRLIREADPDVTFCLSTNGLLLPLYAQKLIDLGVTHVTVTMNAVEPKIGARIYKHVDYMGMRFTGEAGASVLLANQLSGLKYLTEHGIICKVNCVTLKGINDEHIETVTEKLKEIGVYLVNIMPHIPVEGSAFAHLDTMNNKEINALRKKCEKNVKQMYHCRQCRADAIGRLEDDRSIEFRGCTGSCGEKKPAKKIRLAVATKSGMLVDSHFGHAEEFYIYESDGEKACFVEKRPVQKYCAGSSECDEPDGKMNQILSAVADCSGVLALRIGVAPSLKLSAKGIKTIQTYDRIEDAVVTAAKSIAAEK